MRQRCAKLGRAANPPALWMWWCILALTAVSFCGADTFINRENGETLHGYETSSRDGAATLVQATERGAVKLNLAEWKVVPDRTGRRNEVVVVELTGPIMYEIETDALEKAVVRIGDEGPLFILLEVDTPGGRVDLAQRICAALSGADNVQVITYIEGGPSGGALSAGAAVCLATDKIYMANDTVIGAATMITGEAQTMKQAYGEAVGEKLDSAWRAILASLAERRGRSGLLARAMVDRDIEAVEVNEGGHRLFIEPVNKKPDQELIKTWSRKGSLLTLTAGEAVNCGFADGIAASREELLRKEGVADANVVVDDTIQRAATELRRAQGQLGRIRKLIDFEVKKSQGQLPPGEALRILRDAKDQFKALLNLAHKYPDLELDVTALEDEYNSINAAYINLKRQARQN